MSLLEAEVGARPNLLDQFNSSLENKGKQQVQGYDVIGDIHGHADALCRLLEKLGYRKSSGVYRHPDRKVIYLGDFIDRGPDQVEVINIARSMCEAGAALAVMGNHEFNALAWATRRGDGAYLRPHTEANLSQHKEFLSRSAKIHWLIRKHSIGFVAYLCGWSCQDCALSTPAGMRVSTHLGRAGGS